jgi:hypothetical protein
MLSSGRVGSGREGLGLADCDMDESSCGFFDVAQLIFVQAAALGDSCRMIA